METAFTAVSSVRASSRGFASIENSQSKLKSGITLKFQTSESKVSDIEHDPADTRSTGLLSSAIPEESSVFKSPNAASTKMT